MVRVVEFTSAGSDVEATGDATLGFFAALAKQGLKSAIPNLSARLGAIVGPKTPLPYVVSVDGGGPCYLSSFTRMYMDGAADEFGTSGNRLLRFVAPGVAAGGRISRALGMDDVVTVNNNLWPTSHVPDWTGLDIGAMTGALTAQYPRHAIWVRGLTDRLHADEIAKLEAHGYLIAPSRPVEILDPRPQGWKIAENVSRDLKKVRRLAGMTSFVGGPFSEADFAAMERFSHLTTVTRHSILMPHYTAAFFRACADWPDCRLEVLRDASGSVCGFGTTIIGESRITCGSVGFDPDREHAQEIYRALIALQIEHAAALKLPYNVGYGATAFKRLRGTSPAMEFSAFQVRHLPAVKRNMWLAAISAMANLAGSVVKRL